MLSLIPKRWEPSQQGGTSIGLVIECCKPHHIEESHITLWQSQSRSSIEQKAPRKSPQHRAHWDIWWLYTHVCVAYHWHGVCDSLFSQPRLRLVCHDCFNTLLSRSSRGGHWENGTKLNYLGQHKLLASACLFHALQVQLYQVQLSMRRCTHRTKNRVHRHNTARGERTV